MTPAHSHESEDSPLSKGGLTSFNDLREQFGPVDTGSNRASRDMVGDYYGTLLTELAQIAEYQWRRESRRGLVKGFLLSGPPGVGKTCLSRRLAYELGMRFAEPSGGDGVVLASVDGAEVARGRYGESEKRIRDIFEFAQARPGGSTQRTVLLFDDVESIFMSRDGQHAKEWHFSQDNVFFHAVDEMDTRRSLIILTTNRLDLIDEAIRDRFLKYRIEYPDADALVEVARHLAEAHDFAEGDLAGLETAIRVAITSGGVRSMRDAERFVVRQYIQVILGRPAASSP